MTFTIVAHDPTTGTVGLCQGTSAMGVASRCTHVRSGVAAVASQSHSDWRIGRRALDLAEPLGHALAEIQRTLEFTQAFDLRSSAATFNLGLSEHPTFALLPRLVEVLQEIAPAIILRVRSFTARDEAVAMLRAEATPPDLRASAA